MRLMDRAIILAGTCLRRLVQFYAEEKTLKHDVILCINLVMAASLQASYQLAVRHFFFNIFQVFCSFLYDYDCFKLHPSYLSFFLFLSHFYSLPCRYDFFFLYILILS